MAVKTVKKLAQDGVETVANGEFDGFASAGERAACQFVAFAEQAVEQSSTDLARVAGQLKTKLNPKAQKFAKQCKAGVTAFLADVDEHS